jgi:hypothetical protein
VNEPADNPDVWTEMVKSLFAAIFSAGFGDTMILETMLEVEGIFPMTTSTVKSSTFWRKTLLAPYQYRYMSQPCLEDHWSKSVQNRN